MFPLSSALNVAPASPSEIEACSKCSQYLNGPTVVRVSMKGEYGSCSRGGGGESGGGDGSGGRDGMNSGSSGGGGDGGGDGRQCQKWWHWKALGKKSGHPRTNALCMDLLLMQGYVNAAVASPRSRLAPPLCRCAREGDGALTERRGAVEAGHVGDEGHLVEVCPHSHLPPGDLDLACVCVRECEAR